MILVVVRAARCRPRVTDVHVSQMSTCAVRFSGCAVLVGCATLGCAVANRLDRTRQRQEEEQRQSSDAADGVSHRGADSAVAALNDTGIDGARGGWSVWPASLGAHSKRAPLLADGFFFFSNSHILRH